MVRAMDIKDLRRTIFNLSLTRSFDFVDEFEITEQINK